MLNKTFILIHGAWHGSWCWEKITPLLETLGHKVFCPNLPGRGNSTRYHKEINLDTYVNYICQIIDTIHEPVILVGHSMAGMIISQVAERRPERVEQLIYVCAFLPKNKDSLFQIVNAINHNELPKLEFDNEKKTVGLSKHNCRELFYHDCSNEISENAISRLSIEPMIPMMSAVSLSNKFEGVKKRYIECTADNMLIPQAQKIMHTQTLCEVLSLESSHSPFYSMPEKLVQLLVS